MQKPIQVSRNVTPDSFPVFVPLEGLKVRFVGIYDDIRTFRGDIDNCLETQLFRVFKEFKGNFTIAKETDYVKRYLRIAEMRGFKPKVEELLNRKLRLFTYIRKKHFIQRKRKGDPILLLKEPFWKTRYGGEFDSLEGPEIWEGVSVCAALWVTNQKRVKVLWAKDRAPGTKEVADDPIEFKLNSTLHLF